MKIIYATLLTLATLPSIAQTAKTPPAAKISKQQQAADIQRKTDAFEAAKGKMQPPVDNGLVVIDKAPHGGIVGKQKPEMKITAADNSDVHAIFEGDVASITKEDGGSTVLLQHGSYISAYGNLSVVSVTKGQHINAGNVLGKITGRRGQKATLRLEIWKKDAKKVNIKIAPQEWLADQKR